ncbi:MAG: hypothetical protein Q4E28_03350 [Clostridia bacterium]|nr:hypothetical protein [Clostridia bacterium]
MKKIKNIFVFLCIIIFLLPAIFTNHKSGVRSEINNTNLPELHGKEIFNRGKLNDYITERVGFHDKSIDFYLNFNDIFFKELLHPSYSYGKDGYIFGIPNESIVDKKFIDDFAIYLKNIQDYCKLRDVPFVYCINPSKESVYPHLLPNGYNRSNENISYLTYKLDELGVNYISNIEYLRNIAKKEQIYNVKFDPGHWNDLGAMYGTNRVLSHMKKDYPDIQTKSVSDFDSKKVHVTKLPVSNFKIDEWVPEFRNKETEKIQNDTKDFEEIELHPQHPAFNVHKMQAHTSLNLPKVLVFAGSYYNRNRDFYTSAFRESYSIHNYENLLNFEYYFNIFQPEYVILFSAEHTIRPNYYNPTLLANKKLNPPLEEVIKTSKYKYIKLPAKLYKDDKIDTEISNLGLKEFNIKRNKALEKISFSNDMNYKFGYIKKDDLILDLIVNDKSISCTTNINNLTFDNAEIYLFK